MSKILSQFVPWVGPFFICLWHSTPFISFTVLVTNWSVALFTFHSLPPWNISPIWTANVPALLAGSFCSRCLHPATLYLAKAAFSQHHQEVKIGQFHPVPVAVVVKFGDGVGRLFFRSLGPRTDLGSLEGEAHRKHRQSWRMPALSVQTQAPWQAVDPATYAPDSVKSTAQYPQCKLKTWRPDLAPPCFFYPSCLVHHQKLSLLPPSCLENSFLLPFPPVIISHLDNPPWLPPHWALHAATVTFMASLAQMVKNLPAMEDTRVWFLDWEDPLEKGMATHLSILAWRIPKTEEPGGLQSVGSQGVGHEWLTHTLGLLLLHTQPSQPSLKCFSTDPAFLRTLVLSWAQMTQSDQALLFSNLFTSWVLLPYNPASLSFHILESQGPPTSEPLHLLLLPYGWLFSPLHQPSYPHSLLHILTFSGKSSWILCLDKTSLSAPFIHLTLHLCCRLTVCLLVFPTDWKPSRAGSMSYIPQYPRQPAKFPATYFVG